jgi:hypothetical protein
MTELIGVFNPADFKGTPYTGVLLDEESCEKLRALAPEGWKFLGHHMVLNMGPLDTKLNRPANLGRRYKLVAHLMAQNEKVVAVAVWSPLKTVNRRAHVAVAVNREKQGRASDANKLIGWTKLRPTLELWGTVMEFGRSQEQAAVTTQKKAAVATPKKAKTTKAMSNAEMFGPINPDSPFRVLRDMLKQTEPETITEN